MWTQIDVSFLPVPDENQHDPKIGMQGWGYLPYNDPELLEWFEAVGYQNRIKTVFEIGTFAGYSATMFLEMFPYLEKITTIDPNHFSVKAGAALKQKYGDKVEFIQTTSGWYKERDQVDLVYIDGSHIHPKPARDIDMALAMKPRFIMMDNIELPGVRKAVQRFKLMDIKYNPQYFYYTNEHRGKRSPGIIGLFDVDRGGLL